VAGVTRRRFLTGIGAALAGTAGAASCSPDSPPGEEAALTDAERAGMERLAATFIDAHDVPGLSVAFARGATLIYAQGFGFADVGRRIPVTPGHRFRIASVSKPITACALFGLIERGRLALGDRVFGAGAILGTEYGRARYGPDIERITVEHLLTHTAGGWSNSERDPMGERLDLSGPALISWVLDSVPLERPPGTRYAYSNFGYLILGRVIERVTGRPYDRHVQETVLSPCGIDDMAIAGSRLSERAVDEVEYFGEGGENPYGLHVKRMDAHGGWLATATSLTRFATRVDGFPVPRDILSPGSIEAMTTPGALNRSYGRGWHLDGKGTWWHDGSLPGTLSILVRTAGGLCWAALANTRRRRTNMGDDLDRLMWNMSRIRSVPDRSST
jgi:CubicO group peptidase (beta-lactamase class C family)